MLMLTIVPATSLTMRPQLSRLLNLNVMKRRSVPCMSLGDMKTNILSAVVVPMLVISSSTVSPSFAESAASKDIASITRLDKVKQSVVSKQASDRSSANLSDRVEKIENNIIQMLGDINYLQKGFADLTQDVNEVKSDIRGIVVVSALLLIRSEFKDNEMKKELKAEMKINKEESDAKMAKADAKMAKADAKTDRNFLITTGISTGALLVSLVMTLATKK